MKIAFVDELAFTERHGGSARTTVELANALRSKGIKTEIFSLANKIKTFNCLGKLRKIANLREILVFPFIGIFFVPKIEEKFDLVHFSSITTIFSRKPKIPCVVTTRCLFSRQTELLSKHLGFPYTIIFNKFTYKIFEFFEKKGLQNADQIIVYKQALKEFIVENMQIDPNKISVVPLSINNEKFKKNEINNKKKNWVLYIGRGTKPKGFHNLIKISKKINGKIVAIAPNTPKKYKKIINKLDNWKLYGKVPYDKAIEILGQSKIFVMLSLSETGPRVTLEALASGLPIVCTPEGSAGVVKNKKNGYVIKPDNVDQFVRKINFLLSNNKIRKKIAQNNMVKAKELTAQNRAEKVIKVYKKSFQIL